MAENTPNLSTISALPQEGVQAGAQLQNTLVQQQQIAQEANRAAGAQALGYAEIASREKQFAQEQEGVERRFNQELQQGGQQFEQGLAAQTENQRRQREMMAWQQKQAQNHDLRMKEWEAGYFDENQKVDDQLKLLDMEEETAKGQGLVEEVERIQGLRKELQAQREANESRLAKAQVMHTLFQPGGGLNFEDAMKYSQTLDLQEDEKWKRVGASIESYFAYPEEARATAQAKLVDDFVKESVNEPNQRAGATQFLMNLMNSRSFDQKQIESAVQQFGLTKGEIGTFLNLMVKTATKPGPPSMVNDPETGEPRMVEMGVPVGGADATRLMETQRIWERAMGMTPSTRKSAEVMEEVAKQLSQGYLDDPELRKMMDGLPAKQRDAILKWGKQGLQRLNEMREGYITELQARDPNQMDTAAWELARTMGNVGQGKDLRGAIGGQVEKARSKGRTIEEQIQEIGSDGYAQAGALRKYNQGKGKEIAEKRKGILAKRPQRKSPSIPGLDDYKE